jgi:hypothetical protein
VCTNSDDCDDGRICSAGFCVVGEVDASTMGVVDASPDAPPDAAIIQQTFAVGIDCNGGRCTGGRDGNKNASGDANSAKLCADHTLPHVVDFTISQTQPGGKFCTFDPGAMQFNCDPSCSGCNPIDSVTCSSQ